MLTEQDLAKVAKLSRIHVEEGELAARAEELSGILNWIEQLQEVDTDGVPAMSGVGEDGLRLRADEVTDGDKKEAVLKNAPDAQYGCYAVPKMVDEG